ncbi:MAG: hypothetical protein ACC652_04150 [Acidimicrobiales bacterium]
MDQIIWHSVRVSRPLNADEQLVYDHVDREVVARARISIVPWLPAKASGMCLNRSILLKRGRELDPMLVAHELVHAQQWSDYGVVGFLRRYLWDYARGFSVHRNHQSTYRALRFERAARAGAAAWRQEHPRFSPPVMP